MVLGWSLRSAIGLELEILTRENPWLTDDHPLGEEPLTAWRIQEPSMLDHDAINVSIGVLRDPSGDLSTMAGVKVESILALHLPKALVSGQVAQASVATVKRSVDTAVTRLRPKAIKLFIAGPAAFAVALGHRWNAMPPTQLHEFQSREQRYVATACL